MAARRSACGCRPGSLSKPRSVTTRPQTAPEHLRATVGSQEFQFLKMRSHSSKDYERGAAGLVAEEHGETGGSAPRGRSPARCCRWRTRDACQAASSLHISQKGNHFNAAAPPHRLHNPIISQRKAPGCSQSLWGRFHPYGNAERRANKG